MASLIKIKRSATSGKRPTLEQVALGELALNTYDGYLFTERDTGGVGIGTTVTLLTPWTENYGAGSIYYQNNVGIGTTNTYNVKLSVDGTVKVTGISTFTDRVIFDSTNSIQIPSGTTAQRDAVGTAVTGQIRFNTELSSFEGYGPGGEWGSLGGVKDVDQDTFIRAEVSAGSDEDTLEFLTAGSIRVAINSTGQVGIGTTIPTTTLDVFGHTELDTLNVSGVSTLGITTFTNITSQQLNVSGVSTFTDRVIFDSTNSIQIPVGTEAQKDAVGTAVTGQIRFNTTNAQFEGFGVGNNWGSLGGVKDVDGDTYVKPESSPGSDEDALTFFTGGTERAVIDSDGNIGIGTTNPTAKLDVRGTLNVSGVSTLGTVKISSGIITATSGVVTYYGDGQYLDLTNSVALGGDTTGDYVQSITGTPNEVEVTGGSGESSTPQIGLPNNVTIGQDLTITRDLQVTRNLNVDGNITIGGTSATLFTQTLQVADADLVLGIRTDSNGEDISTDNTANHGGIAIASTEGTPLVTLVNPGAGETLPSTYKKIMWFKSGSFSGLGTDAWLSNYAIGIGSTQVPDGVRLAAGGVQITENDISVVRDINASGIATLPTIDATNATIDNLTFTSGTAITSVDTDLTAVSSSDDTLASAKAIKTYVDSQVTAQDLDFAGDSGTGAVDLDTQSFSIFGTTNEIETVGSGQSITIGLPNVVAITTSLTVGDATGITGGAPADQGVLSVYTSGGKNGLIIQTSDNSQSRGVAFRNSADAYIGYISIENAGSNLGDMVFGVSNAIETDVDNVDERVRFTKDGDVGIGTINPTEKLDVIGTVKAIDFDTTSDQNLKTNIKIIEDPLEKIVQIRGVNFEWKENNKPSAGVIAQEVEKVLPELVTNNGTRAVNYNGLIGLLIEAVKAQQKEIDILKSKIK